MASVLLRMVGLSSYDAPNILGGMVAAIVGTLFPVPWIFPARGGVGTRKPDAKPKSKTLESDE